MDFSHDEDLDQVRQSLARFVSVSATEADVRRVIESDPGYDEKAWSVLAGQLGVSGLGVDEDRGGSGFGFAAVAVVAQELGGALHPSPFLASRVLALETVLALDPDDDLVPAVAAGATAALALSNAAGAWSAESVSVKAAGPADDLRLSGTASFVIDGASAEHLLVVARHSEGLLVAHVDPAADGVTRTPLETIDLTRRQAGIRFDGVPARAVGGAGRAEAAIERTLDRVYVALAAEQVGGAQRCLDLAVEHARSRVQFGRPIGSFQAIKHLCADVLLELDAARSAVTAAAWSVDHDPGEVPVLASMVKAHCSEMYEKAARACIQVNGGMGFTWEHPAHLYFKRAMTSALMFGTPSHHREQLVSRLAIGVSA